MSKASEQARKAELKRTLSEKYSSLAKATRSQPKRRAYLYRAERYARQAQVLSRQAGE
jgi:hypothetical protein